MEMSALRQLLGQTGRDMLSLRLVDFDPLQTLSESFHTIVSSARVGAHCTKGNILGRSSWARIPGCRSVSASVHFAPCEALCPFGGATSTGDDTMKQIGLLAAVGVSATLVLPRLAAAQTAPAIPPSITTPDKVESHDSVRSISKTVHRAKPRWKKPTTRSISRTPSTVSVSRKLRC